MDGKKEIPPFITLARKLFNDPMWTQERFSYAQAWVDLLYWAFHSDGDFKWEGERYKLKRGQLGHTESFLMKRWKWSRGRLRRTIKKWQAGEQLTVHRSVHRSVHGTVHCRNVITICNYDQYQLPNSTGGTSNGTSIGTRCEPQTVHNKKELKEEIYRKNYKSARPRENISEKDKKKSIALRDHLRSRADELEKQQKFDIA